MFLVLLGFPGWYCTVKCTPGTHLSDLAIKGAYVRPIIEDSTDPTKYYELVEVVLLMSYVV